MSEGEFKKALEENGPFAGLWVRTANALRKGGFRTKSEVRRAIASKALQPSKVHDYGKYADREVRAWLGIP